MDIHTPDRRMGRGNVARTPDEAIATARASHPCGPMEQPSTLTSRSTAEEPIACASATAPSSPIGLPSSRSTCTEPLTTSALPRETQPSPAIAHCERSTSSTNMLDMSASESCIAAPQSSALAASDTDFSDGHRPIAMASAWAARAAPWLPGRAIRAMVHGYCGGWAGGF
jgi:hypothetical protein